MCTLYMGFMLLCLCAAHVVAAQAQEPAPASQTQVPDNPWAKAQAPAQGEAAPIGGYSAGCLRGAAELPLDGPGYQVMRPSRMRYYGHPDLIGVIERLGRKLQERHLGDVMVGDMSQPRGGPAPNGHSSHQTGLDVDLWFWQPEEAAHGSLSRAAREASSARSAVDLQHPGILKELRERVLTLLQFTAQDEHVARIFVHPLIKRDACSAAPRGRTQAAARAWLKKVRPWYGHDDHFHVRLACPASATDCVTQAPLPEGDGCGSDLAYWLSPAAEEDRKKGQAQYQAKLGKAVGMPPQCLQLVAAEDAATAAAPISQPLSNETQASRIGSQPRARPQRPRKPYLSTARIPKDLQAGRRVTVTEEARTEAVDGAQGAARSVSDQ